MATGDRYPDVYANNLGIATVEETGTGTNPSGASIVKGAHHVIADSGLASNTVTIASGESTSGALDLSESYGSRSLVGLQTPSAWTAAAISFLVSVNNSTFTPLYNADGTEVTIPSASIATGEARAFSLNPSDFSGWRYVKVVSGVNGTTVNQGGARVVTLVFREV